MGSSTGSGDIFWSTGNDGTNLISIDTNTASVIQNYPAHGFTETWAGAFDTDGIFYTLVDGFTAPRLSRFNLATGAVTAFATSTAPENAIALEVDAAGNMFAAGYVSGTLYSVNKVSGEFSSIGNFGIANMMDLVFDGTGRLWGTVSNNLYEIDPATGMLLSTTRISGIVTGSAMGIAVDTSDNFFLTAYESSGRVYGLDPATGVANLIGPTGVNRPHGGDVIPEPATGLLFLSGGLFGLRRRR